jgi:hypothetical protein
MFAKLFKSAQCSQNFSNRIFTAEGSFVVTVFSVAVTDGKTTYYAMRSFVDPLIEEGKLKMTVPDKPRSRNQRYYSELVTKIADVVETDLTAFRFCMCIHIYEQRSRPLVKAAPSLVSYLSS